MQLDETRATNAINWWKYSNAFADKEDEYGTFFAAWIALVILARDYEATYCSQGGQGSGDDRPIQYCFDNAKDIILAAIRRPDLKVHKERLALRHQGEILRPERRSHWDKLVLTRLSSVWLDDAATETWELRGLKTLLLQVRNGLFHGSKMYNDSTNRESDDRQLLADLNPILLAIIFALLDQPGPHTRLLPRVVS